MVNNMANENNVEKIAAIAHQQWSAWMLYLFKVSFVNKDGSYTIPKWYVDRWKRQINTEYSQLPENEKESDRDEARLYIQAMTEDKHLKYHVG